MRKIIIACFFILVSQLNFAQSKKLSGIAIIPNEINDSLQDLNTYLQDLAVKNNLHLAYESHILKNKFCKTYFQNDDLKKNLDLIFKDTGLEYKIVNGNQLLIRNIKEKELDYRNLFGQIKDKSNKEELEYVGVYLKGSNIGSYSDNDGKFKLTIASDFKSKDDTIIIHRIGYEDKKIALNKFIQNMDVDLEVKSNILPKVLIIPPLSKIGIKSTKFGLGSTQINNETYLANSLLSNDVLRKLQLLPSVTANNDNSANLQIRGGETFETLVLIDGLRLYNPTHFYNVFSAINNDYVSTIKFYKNDIPRNIRSMTGGVVDIKSKPINHTSYSGNLDFNLMDLSAYLNIPISKRIGFNFAARKSIFDQTKNSLFGEIISANQTELEDENILRLKGEKNNLDFDFYDINAKLDLQINSKSELVFNFYKSEDNFLDFYNKNYLIRKNSPQEAKFDFNFNDFSEWKNQGIGINYNVNWKNLKTKIILSQIQYDEDSGLKIDIVNTFNGNNKTKNISNFQRSSIEDKVIKIDNDWKVSNNKNLNFGIDFTSYNVISDIKVKDESIYSNNNSTSFYNAYSSFRYNWKQWILNLSLQSSYYTGTNKNYFNPGISLKYYVNDKWNLFTSFNKQHQYLREFEYETQQSKNISIWALVGEDDPILSANNYSIGCSYKNTNSYFVFEMFQKNRDGISVLLLQRPGIQNQPPKNEYKIFYGNGYIKGFDIMWVQKIKNYQCQISYTYSVNKRRFKHTFKNQYYPSPDDSRNQLKWVNNINLKNWEFELNLIYSSGTPYFDFSELEIDKTRKLLDFNDYLTHIPDYFRSDISMGYNFQFLNKTSKLVLSVFNLTNRINISNNQLIYSGNETNDNKSKFVNSQNDLLSRTINLGFNIKI